MKQYVWPLVRRRLRTIAAVAVAVLLSTAATIAGPALIRYAIDDGLTVGDETALERVALAFLALVLVKPLLQRFIVLRTARAGEGFLADLRTATYNRLQELSLPYFEGERAGVLVSRLTADIQSLTTFVRLAMPEVVTNVILVAATLVVLVVLAPKLLLFALVSLPVVIGAWIVYHRRSEPAYLAVRDTVATTLAVLQERFAGVRVIQAFRRERDAFAGYEERSREQIAAWQRASYVNIGFFPLIAFGQALALSGVLVGGAVLYDRGEVTIGTVAAFVLYVAALFDPIARLAEWFSEFRSGQAALKKIVGVLETPVTVSEHEAPRGLPEHGDHAADEVVFAYGEGQRVLDDVAIAVVPGERVALVGPTGAGKSTLAKLLTRKYDPLGGAVAFGDIDLRAASFEALRSRIVFVPQEGHLFSGSLADNVRLARPEASDEEVQAALRAIAALDRFERLPDGLDTDVRSRGVRLSAGERQLVSLARVLLADPAVIVLDEATSSVDAGTERAVERALSVVAKGRTVITIAHRLSTAERADRVAVLRDGRLVELGPHAELVARGGFYAELWRSWIRSGAEPAPEPV
ncbi:MAG: ABC transporter ATP-binding protein/permease [Actinomycetota bacterium]|nr:ABC transporter ATP-binding protein/permease [Actinomycetota bacterium]